MLLLPLHTAMGAQAESSPITECIAGHSEIPRIATTTTASTASTRIRKEEEQERKNSFAKPRQREA